MEISWAPGSRSELEVEDRWLKSIAGAIAPIPTASLSYPCKLFAIPSYLQAIHESYEGFAIREGNSRQWWAYRHGSGQSWINSARAIHRRSCKDSNN